MYNEKRKVVRTLLELENQLQRRSYLERNLPDESEATWRTTSRFD